MKPVATVVACALLALAAAVAGCGGDEPEPRSARLTADLVVTVHPSGADGPAERRAVRCRELGRQAAGAECRRLGGLTAAQLAPVPASTACTQIYGGEATARVRGRLRGRPVDARFELSDGCEIERWDRNRVLLGDAP